MTMARPMINAPITVARMMFQRSGRLANRQTPL